MLDDDLNVDSLQKQQSTDYLIDNKDVEDFSTPNSSKWDFRMLRKQYKSMNIDFEGV